MSTLFCLVLSFLRSSLRSRAALQAEVLALRHQLLVLQRSTQGRRVRFGAMDRIFWVWLSRLWPGWRSRVRIMKADTIMAWNRKGLRLYWTWKSRARKGRPCKPREIRDLIRQMSLANPGWGAPRIHGEFLKTTRQVPPTPSCPSLRNLFFQRFFATRKERGSVMAPARDCAGRCLTSSPRMRA
jgi:hypothetical protein